jgi:hypothetical protein
MAIPYKEGQFFLLPIERGHYAVGLIARAPPRGGVLLGYFFGPRRSQAPVAQWLAQLHPQTAALVCRFKDTGLYRGEWPLLQPLESFTRAAWPVPPFHRFDGSVTHVPGAEAIQNWKVEYGDDNLIVPIKETPAQGADLKLPDDLAYDTRFLSDTVANLIKDMAPTADDTTWR